MILQCRWMLIIAIICIDIDILNNHLSVLFLFFSYFNHLGLTIRCHTGFEVIFLYNLKSQLGESRSIFSGVETHTTHCASAQIPAHALLQTFPPRPDASGKPGEDRCRPVRTVVTVCDAHGNEQAMSASRGQIVAAGDG